MQLRLSRWWCCSVPMMLLALGGLVWPPQAASARPSAKSPMSLWGITVQATGSRQVCVQWLTDVPSTTRVDYDVIGAAGYGYSWSSDNLVTQHSADLTNLQAKRVYRFKVTSTIPVPPPGEDEVVFEDGNVFASPGEGLSNPDWQWPIPDTWWGDTDEVGRDWAAQVYVRRADSEFEGTTRDPDFANNAQLIRLASGDNADAVWQAVTLSSGSPQDYIITGRVRLGPLEGGGEMKGIVAYSVSGGWSFQDATQVEVIDETAITDPQEGSDWRPFAVTFTAASPAGTIFLGGHHTGGSGWGEVMFDEVTFGRLTYTEYYLWPWDLDTWHLISLPLAPESLDWPTVFNWGFSPPLPHVLNGALYRYDPVLQGYVAYYDSSPGDFGPAQYGVGAWWYPMVDISVQYRGRAPNFDVRIPLTPQNGGWSLIGHPFPYPVPVERCRVYNPYEPDPFSADLSLFEAVQARWINLPFYRWSLTYLGYLAINLPGSPDAVETDLRPWCGYWVNVNQPDLVLIIPWELTLRQMGYWGLATGSSMSIASTPR